MQRVLVTGANGQIGSELVQALRQRPGTARVIGADLEPPPEANGAHEVFDVRDREALRRVMDTHEVDTVFHLASLLSASGEQAPDRAWAVNMDGLKNVLDLARRFQNERGEAMRIFWPSSIAAFGPATGTPAPQQAVLDPATMYGVTKVSGELLGRYYHQKYGVDVRSLRYPGLISYAAPPGGGTTDYAVEMCCAAAEGQSYTCFVKPETRLPMMYMPDALRAALDLMDAPAGALSVRTSYNVGALSFTAEQLAGALQARVPGFECRYAPDERQQIADSWPASVNDQPARDDWGWQPEYDLDALTRDMLKHLRAAERSTLNVNRSKPCVELEALNSKLRTRHSEAMPDTAARVYQQELDDIKEAGLYKEERVITSDQDSDIEVAAPGTLSERYAGDGAPTASQAADRHVINFCANNYLGLANNARLKEAAKEGVDRYGFGLASVRFICGTQTIHKRLEARLADFFEMDDAILYAACFDANTGLFETILGEEDAILSDALNHASIIDGIRLCKAERYRFHHSDMGDLENKLQQAQDQRLRLIATDGVFSMDGDVAKLDEICDLADEYDAMVMVDDCHGTGFFGETGRGSLEHTGTLGRVDIVTSTLGKALGGATGGFTTGRQDVIDLLRQQSRPYLFSNSVAPPIVHAGLEALDMLEGSSELRDTLQENTRYFRDAMTEAGFDIKAGEHPIVPIMLHEARLASDMADDLLDEGIYVIGFSYPVVPKGEARIRVQVSAAHTRDQLDRAVEAFTEVGRRHGVIE